MDHNQLILFENFSEDLLPAFVYPKDDELLTSWLFRLSAAHLIKIHSFCKQLFPGHEIWTRDIDKSASIEILQVLSKRTNTSLERVINTTLWGLEPNLSKHVNKLGSAKWIIPAGRSHRIVRNNFLQYCPSCLDKDGSEVYFRRRWRLSLSICCPHCHLYLLDSCAECSKPIMFYRQDIGHKNEVFSDPIRLCFFCKSDLSKAKQDKADKTSIELQNHLYKILQLGYFNDIQYSHLYFDVLYHVCDLLISKHPKSQVLRNVINEKTNYRIQLANNKAKQFDFYSINDRISILNGANWLLSNWPKHFIEICLENGIYSSYVLREFYDCPYWFSMPIKENLSLIFSEFKKHNTEIPSYTTYSRYADHKIKKNKG